MNALIIVIIIALAMSGLALWLLSYLDHGLPKHAYKEWVSEEGTHHGVCIVCGKPPGNRQHQGYRA